MLFVSHGGGEEGPGSGVDIHSGDGHHVWGDHGESKGVFDEDVSSSKCLLGFCGVSSLQEPEYPPQHPDSSEDLSGSGLLGVDGGVWLSW